MFANFREQPTYFNRINNVTHGKIQLILHMDLNIFRIYDLIFAKNEKEGANQTRAMVFSRKNIF